MYLLTEIGLVFTENRTIIGVLAILDLIGVVLGFVSACISPLLWVEQLADIPVAALMVLYYYELRDAQSEANLERRLKGAIHRSGTSSETKDDRKKMSHRADHSQQTATADEEQTQNV